MSENLEHLKTWLHDIAHVIEQNESLDASYYTYFIQEPELGFWLVDIIAAMEELDSDEAKPYYSACVFALEICISQLQAASESHNKQAEKKLQQLMSHLAEQINSSQHSLSFWLPVFNAFYEVHVELTEELKSVYFDLASQEDVLPYEDEVSHLNSMRDLIQEMADLSDFDIAENFFAQSHALPPEFYSDLVLDLYSIEEGQEVALLTLLHPNFEVRQVVLVTIGSIIDKITLSSQSLSRLQAIKSWYPEAYHEEFDAWIKLQRKKGVVFPSEKKAPRLSIKASEVDGSGAQGIFIHIHQDSIHHLAGMLLKVDTGIKDAWFIPNIPEEDVACYYDESFEESVMLRAVDLNYVLMMTNHFLGLGLEKGTFPDLHLLEIQEVLGLQFVPRVIEADALLSELAIRITPFTPERVNEAMKHSKAWVKHKRFTASWYLENPRIDALVNQHCSFEEGIKVCDFESAIDAVISIEMESNRPYWIFHFLWVALWLKVKARSNEKTWEDCLLIAHSIANGCPLQDVPVLAEVAYQTVQNSIETMNERRTHLSRPH